MADGSDRESIWSVPRRVRAFYAVLFGVSTVGGWVTLVVLTPWEAKSIPYYGTCVLVSAAGSVIVVEIGAGIMAIADVIKEWQAKRLEAARREGEERAAAKWIAWNARREEAERLNQPFDEPPPETAPTDTPGRQP